MGRLTRIVCAVALCGLVPCLAGAQSAVTNPTTVAFSPSSDHALLTGYDVGYFAVGITTPISTVTKTLVQLTVSGSDYTFAFPRLLFGTYEIKLRACAGTTCSAWVAADKTAAVLPLAPSVVRVQ